VRQNSRKLLTELRHVIRLLDDTRQCAAELLADFTRSMPCRYDDRDVRADFVHESESLPSAHDGHCEIHQHRSDCVRLLPKHAHRFLSLLSDQDRVSGSFQNRPREIPNQGIVIHEEDDSGAIKIGFWKRFRFRQLDWHSRKHDSERAALSRRTPIAILQINTDITERKRAEEQTKELAALVENSKDFIGLASIEGNVLFVNAASQSLAESPGNDDLRRTQLLDFVAEDDRERTSCSVWYLALNEFLRFRFSRLKRPLTLAVSFACIRSRIFGNIL
jgi:PAS domain-containing protein